MVGPIFLDQSIWWTGHSALPASSLLFDYDARAGLGTSASTNTSNTPRILHRKQSRDDLRNHPQST